MSHLVAIHLTWVRRYSDDHTPYPWAARLIATRLHMILRIVTIWTFVHLASLSHIPTFPRSHIKPMPTILRGIFESHQGHGF